MPIEVNKMAKGRTLFVSDLDGTLLRSDESLSAYTCQILHKLSAEGLLFSYATARSLVTAKKVTKGLRTQMPLVVYNGAFIMDHLTEEVMLANYFDDTVSGVFSDLLAQGVWPIVYAYVDGVEKFSYMENNCSEGMRDFIRTRKGDPRANPVMTAKALTAGKCFYITCIDTPEKLEPFYEKYRDRYHAVYQKDIYSGEQWLEILPKEASKSNAVLQLKRLLQCDRLVVFGDGRNDLDMFEIADECYAVENAAEELKQIATGIIGRNDADGVAKFLEARFAGS